MVRFFTLVFTPNTPPVTTHKGKYSQYARPVKETPGSDVRRREANRSEANNDLGFINISIFKAYLVPQRRKPLTEMSGNHH